jgi:surface protein
MRALFLFAVMLSSPALTGGQILGDQTGDQTAGDPFIPGGGIVNLFCDERCNPSIAMKGDPVPPTVSFAEAVSDYIKNLGYFNVAKFPYGNVINCWDVSNVIDMSFAFHSQAGFNERLDCWNVSNVKTMHGMFSFADGFNRPLDTWDMSSVVDTSAMFNGAISFNQPLDTWDMSSVVDTSDMFNGAISFNQPLNQWNVGNVKNMNGMFNDASAFNQPLDNWDVSNVQFMSFMFADAISFNQDLCDWRFKILHLTSAFNMFLDTPCDVYTPSPVLGLPNPGPFCHSCSQFSRDTACTADSHCSGKNCYNSNGGGRICRCSNKGICTLIPGRCDAILQKTDCLLGAICDKKGYCKNPLDDPRNPTLPGSRGATCTTSSECNTGNCNNSRVSKGSGRICKCTKKGICALKYGKCLLDADCNDGAICKKGTCS